MPNIFLHYLGIDIKDNLYTHSSPNFLRREKIVMEADNISDVVIGSNDVISMELRSKH